MAISTHKDHFHVFIIGAGLAGLTAAALHVEGVPYDAPTDP